MIYFVGVSFWCAFIAKDAVLLHIHFFLSLSMGYDLGILVLGFRPWQDALAIHRGSLAAQTPQPPAAVPCTRSFQSDPGVAFSRACWLAVLTFS